MPPGSPARTRPERCPDRLGGSGWLAAATGGRVGAMSVDVRTLCRVAGAAAAVTTALQAATAVAALRRGRRDYADGVWGPGLAAIAVMSAAVGRGDPWRRWTLAAATAAWAA